MEEKIITVKNAEGEPDTQAKIIHEAKIDYVPKVSVIIPVYNTEKYLRQCLDSVVNQTLKEIEIICVDDGSTDSSLEILKEYARKDNRFTILTQENLYAGVARNAGLAVAKGEYLSFLDSDDWFELDMYNVTYEVANVNQSEIVCFMAQEFDNVKQTYKDCPFPIKKEFYSKLINNKNSDFGNKAFQANSSCPWNKLFKHSYISDKKIYFGATKSVNDLLFVYSALSQSRAITLVDKIFVNYRINNSQSLQGQKSVNWKNICLAFHAFKKELEKLGLYEQNKQSYINRVLQACMGCLRSIPDGAKKSMIDLLFSEYFKLLDIEDYGASYFYENWYYEQYVELCEKYAKKHILPIFPSTIPIIFSVDNNYAPYLAVSIQSIIENSSLNNFYDIVILEKELSEKVKKDLCSMKKDNVSIRFFNVSEYIESVDFFVDRYFSIETYYRVFIPDICNLYKKVIYLDCDIMVRCDIAELYNIDAENNLVVAVNDIVSYPARTKNYKIYGVARREYTNNVLGIADASQYFQAGVLVFNVCEMQKLDMVNIFMDKIKNIINPICHDQDILNSGCASKVKFISQEYNFYNFFNEKSLRNEMIKSRFFDIDEEMKKEYLAAQKEPKIIHFAGNEKIWHNKSDYFSNEWWMYAKHTPFYEQIERKYYDYSKNKIVVSLTSFPKRIGTVYKTIKSILNQSYKPHVLLLWLAEEQFPNKEKDLPQELLELIPEGLTIDWCNDIKSYKKLIPTLKKYPESIIVTADDDNIYPRQWLEKLYNSYLKYPNDIHAHRISKFFYKHGFEVVAGGQDYYKKPSYLNKLVGLGGVLYPPNCFYKDILNEELFMKLAPTNDDQWFWFQAVLNGTKVRVVDNPEIQANYVEGTQEVGLTNINDKGEKLFWKDFNRLIKYYPSLKQTLIAEAKNMKHRKSGTIDNYRKCIRDWYKKVTKKKLNLNKPVTYNEKIQWMKLYDSTPIKTKLADKYLVRDWVKEKIGEEYLIPLLGVYDSFGEIDFDKLPNQFVIKCNHGCAYNIIVKNKNNFDKNAAKEKVNKWMSEDFAFKFGYELHYSNISRKIIIEKYIENSSEDLYDYKFWCFDGKVKYIQFLSERNTNGLKMAFYDRSWKKQKFVYSYPLDEKNIEKPNNLDKMIALAEKLADGFNHVRVDFYRLDNGQIYFGEMTFTSCSGISKWNSKTIDKKLGKMIKIPTLAYNFENSQYYKLKRNWNEDFENIFSLKNDHRGTHKILTILGLKLKYKRRQKGKIGMFEKIFSIRNRESNNHTWYKVIRILGLKFSFKNKALTLRKNIEFQRKELEILEKEIENQKNKINEQKILINETKNKLNQKIDDATINFETRLCEMKKDFDKVHFVAQTETQIKQCIKMYNDIDGDLYFEKYKKLINGLDNESINCISNILARIERIANGQVQYNDILTKEEKNIVQKIKYDLHDKIIKINNGCYAYKEIFLPIRHFETSVFYYKYQLDKLFDLNKIKNASIIDAGAYIGDSALLLSKYSNHKVYAFEPVSQNYNYLCQTIKMNNLENIVPVNKGLGSKEENLQCNLYGGASGLVDKRSDNCEEVKITTLDKYVKENNIQVGLIKVDIEGFEQEFLKGAINTIKEQKPTLLISIYHNASDFFDIKPMIESWDLGYKFKIVKPVDGTIKNETLLIAEQR